MTLSEQAIEAESEGDPKEEGIVSFRQKHQSIKKMSWEESDSARAKQDTYYCTTCNQAIDELELSPSWTQQQQVEFTKRQSELLAEIEQLRDDLLHQKNS